ncbi:MAG: hypothetical protein A2X64_08085 [Ignavibacteria bacterium GWF2_33_9]|nr:MAG: hypothetical protein A2X64_08085 [Ignavibacteria bacterium GWF2_33_9]
MDKLKQIIFIIVLVIIPSILYTQTPYDSYAPSCAKIAMLKLPEVQHRTYNTDTLSKVSYIELNSKSGTLTYYDKQDNLLFQTIVNPLEQKWWTKDPLATKYTGWSPYNYVLNNPINAIDTDGRLVLFFNGMHPGNGGTANYWAGYDKKALNLIKDNSVRYYDGALGGMKALKNAHKGEGLINSSLSFNERFEAGKNLGYGDAANIIKNLSEGEVITSVSHSMGTGFERGFMEGLVDYAKVTNQMDKIKFGNVYDINSFQGASIFPSENFSANYFAKKGGLDGGPSLFDNSTTFTIKLLQMFNRNSVPTVSIPYGAKDITDPSDKFKGHAIGPMSLFGIKESTNPHQDSPLKIEAGNNNENPKIEGEVK